MSYPIMAYYMDLAITEAEVKQNANSDRGLSVEPDDKLPLKWSELKVQ